MSISVVEPATPFPPTPSPHVTLTWVASCGPKKNSIWFQICFDPGNWLAYIQMKQKWQIYITLSNPWYHTLSNIYPNEYQNLRPRSSIISELSSRTPIVFSHFIPSALLWGDSRWENLPPPIRNSQLWGSPGIANCISQISFLIPWSRFRAPLHILEERDEGIHKRYLHEVNSQDRGLYIIIILCMYGSQKKGELNWTNNHYIYTDTWIFLFCLF